MARTEKRFGAAKQVASRVLTDVTGTSLNRRNVVLNVTSKVNSTDTLSIIQATGDILPSYSTATINAGTESTLSGIGDALATGADYIAVSPSGNYAITAYHRGTSTTYLATNAAYWSRSGVTLTNRAIAAVSNTLQSAGNEPATISSDWTNVGFTWGPYVAMIDDETFLLAENGTLSSSTTYRGLAAKFSSTSPYTYTELARFRYNVLDNSTNPSRVAAIVTVRKGSTNDGIGYFLETNDDSDATAGVALGLRIIANQTLYTVAWNTTASKVAQTIAGYFRAASYNSAYPVYAFSSPSNASNAWLGSVSTGGTLASVTLPGSAAPAGFRLVANDGANGDHRKFLDGTITYPAAPTGVTVPTTGVSNGSATVGGGNGDGPVIGLAFSPDGKYLAVAYDRDNPNLTTADSVVVVYTRNEDGTYSHTHSSGANIAKRPRNNSCLTWTKDSSTIIVGTVDGISLWHIAQGSIAAHVNVPHARTTITMSGVYPEVPSMTNPLTTYSVKVGGAASSDFNPLPAVLSVGTIEHIAEAGTPGRLVVVSRHSGSSADELWANILGETQLNAAVTGTVSSATSGNYIATVAQTRTASSAQNRTTSVILEPGEKILVEAATGGTIDVVAYGVEIE